jgi:hypothetical protein
MAWSSKWKKLLFLRIEQSQWKCYQLLVDNVVAQLSLKVIKEMGFDSCTTPIQQLYNNPSHEGGPQHVGPTLM